MRVQIDADVMQEMSDKLGINILGVDIYKLISELGDYDADIAYAYRKIVEDETTPPRFKKEDVAQYAVFIKERMDEVLQKLRKEAREEKAQREKLQKESEAYIKILQKKALEFEQVLTEGIEKAIASGNYRVQGTQNLWYEFKLSIGL